MPDSCQTFVAESVCEGHPDKLADQISDAVLDAHLEQDHLSRVAVETLVTDGLIVVAGEVTSRAEVDIESVARAVAAEIGFNSDVAGLHAEKCRVIVQVQRQAREIAAGVDTGGAGDQGLMFGYATSETPEFMPMPIAIAHAVTRQAAEVRKARPDLGLLPDGKCQAAVTYDGHRPVALDSLVVSLQHEERVTRHLVDIVQEHIVGPVLSTRFTGLDTDGCRMLVNPTGSFVIGGPKADTGLTGRKIIVDTYGGAVPHGGGAFSGKDCTKVDRSAAYMARHVAIDVLKRTLCRAVTVRLAYAIGLAEPLVFQIHRHGEDGTGQSGGPETECPYDLTPAGIRDKLGLTRPIFRETARNGHFGHPEFPWERTGRLEAK